MNIEDTFTSLIVVDYYNVNTMKTYIRSSSWRHDKAYEWNIFELSALHDAEISTRLWIFP